MGYWAARTSGESVIDITDAPDMPRSLRFSSDGRRLLVGGGGSQRADPSWNALYSLADRQWKRFGATKSQALGGRVCAFSHDGSAILTVRNAPPGYAVRLIWDAKNLAKPLAAIPLPGAFDPDCSWVGIEVSPLTGQLVVAIDETLTFFDVPAAR